MADAGAVTTATADHLALLTGPGAGELLRAALDAAGEELLDWQVRSVDHRPGASTTASFRARVRRPDGEVGTQTLGASTALRAPGAVPPGVLVVSDGAQQVAVWRWPDDPGLPALSSATRPAAVRALLAEHGVDDAGLRLAVRSYRPRRRAVVEVRTASAHLFLKVLRPGLVAGLHERHRLLRDAGVPVPPSLGWHADGLLVLEVLPGTLLRTRLREGSGEVPDGAQLLALLDRLPDAVLELPQRRSWTGAAEHYAAVLAGALPGERDRCTQLAGRIRALTADAPADEPTHGDLHEAQLLLEGRRVSGLLDVDTAGPGRRADDLACLLGHAGVLAQTELGHRATTLRTGAAWLGAFQSTVDPVELRARVAGVVLSLATGPHRVRHEGWQRATRDRLDLVEQWLAAAERLD